MVAQLAKSIKPKRISPKKQRAQILNALKKEGKAIEAEFDKTTRSWTGEKPTFKSLIQFRRGDVVLLVGPGGSKEGAEKWVFLNNGTEPHIIRAKNVPNLVFRHGSGFKPKTKVKTFSSGPGANTGQIIKKAAVKHPGIEARDWTGEIVKLRKKRFNRAIVKAVRV